MQATDAGLTINKDSIYETISEVIKYHAGFGNDFEICWGLWLCNALGLKIDKEIAKLISTLENSFNALVALDLKCKGLIIDGLDTSLWKLV